MAAVLAGCGELPRPFEGNPGRMGRLLAMPPPARLAVGIPDGAMLPDASAALFRHDVASALSDGDVPAVDAPPQRGDWRLTLGADLHAGQVTPHFTVIDPVGKSRGSVDGPSIAAEQWSAGTPATLQQVAAAAATPVSTLLTSIEARRQMSDPTSLLNRPAKVTVLSVTGAPGDGNRSLQRKMHDLLPEHGEIVQDNAAGADFTVAGHIKVTPTGPDDGTVEVTWIVNDARGKQAGVVAQVHDEKLALLNGYWGELATAVCTEAAGGVHEVIANQLMKRPATASATTPPASSATPPPIAPDAAARVLAAPPDL